MQKVTRVRLEKQLAEFFDTAPKKQRMEFVPTLLALCYGFVRSALNDTEGENGAAYAQIAQGIEGIFPALKEAQL